MKSKDKLEMTMTDMEKHGRGTASDHAKIPMKSHKPKMKRKPHHRSTHKGHPD